MQKISVITAMMLCLSMFPAQVNADLDKKSIKIISLDVETDPIIINPMETKIDPVEKKSHEGKEQVKEAVEGESGKDEPVKQVVERDVDFYEKKIELLEEHLDVKNDEIKLLEDKIVHREKTIGELESRIK